jgi:predicted O-methyltransferase YrrM
MHLTARDKLTVLLSILVWSGFTIVASRIVGDLVWVAALGLALAIVLVVQFELYRRLQDALRRSHAEPTPNYRQVEALFSLFAALPIDQPLPPLRASAVSPDFANTLVSLIRELRPRTVLELGSGISTLIAAYGLKQSGQGRVVSLEQDEGYARVSRAHLERRGLADWAAVVHAPLRPLTLAGRTWSWYDTAPIENLGGIDLVVVDGPLQEQQPERLLRYPALPVLFGKLSPRAVILLDDADREDERRVVELWLKEYRGLEAEYISSEKGTVILRRAG